jgi:trehalose 6-phosphate phosphatase
MIDPSFYHSLPGRFMSSSPRSDWALFLDLDAALLDTALVTNSAKVVLDLSAALAAISARLDGAAAVLSGRSLYEIDAVLSSRIVPVAAEYGAIMRLPGCGREELALEIPEALMAELADATKHLTGVEIDRHAKTASLRYRLAPQYAQALRAVADLAVRKYAAGFEALDVLMAIDIKSKRVSKGSAIARLMEEAPFKGRVPVFVSTAGVDDLGFAAVRRLGGFCLRLERNFAGRPEELRHWLGWLAERTSAP